MMLFAVALAGSLVFVTGLWYLSEKIRNASIIDACWSLMIAVPAWFYFMSMPQWTLRHFLILTMVGSWALRLSGYIGKRLIHEKREDTRYTKLREQWGSRQALRMLRFFWIQAAAATFFSLPFLIIIKNPSSDLSVFEILGLGLWIVAFIGEALADHQLSAFKRNPANQGKTCRAGLWNYSRHPNYFFEWLIWISFFAFALGSPYGWTAMMFPLMMLYFLRKQTGVPLAEKQALISRAESYRKYQQEVNAFFPWFPKRSSL